jgi:hypothetical protein
MLENDPESSDEDFRKVVSEHLDLIDERLQRLEDEMNTLREGGEGIPESESGSDPDSSP